MWGDTVGCVCVCVRKRRACVRVRVGLEEGTEGEREGVMNKVAGRGGE